MEEIVDDDALPSLDEICSARINARETIEEGLLPMLEREFNRCTAEVLAFSRPDAWQVLGSTRDTNAHRKARRAWTKWCMFAKCVMPILPGGMAK